ncbi:hypothetical protein LH462_09765 [Laribacter hongkongensis]|uniref:Transmembrane protein n=1 Tax=Laribacter hongkongensis TaxID=168471 RepID=A0ABD4SLH5_9NEIS|nr:hypothetical protein [Laribacter hongkongensis]MCG9024508.1 hypothetical protein [Laribacter hongkongensis]MCG9099543.1 hypothetical protein [Laribacter hongkongensis]MCG9104003.1 hypothetical protein [Laribacter hongkongensis]MCG9111674.1 hypothetical protein [Laribacter hongkongensis]MCG9117075.1 hypothetical protein [Laribacter hongkongensis]
MQSFINPQNIKATLIDQAIKNVLFNQAYKKKSKFTHALHSKTKYPSSRNEQSATKINIKNQTINKLNILKQTDQIEKVVQCRKQAFSTTAFCIEISPSISLSTRHHIAIRNRMHQKNIRSHFYMKHCQHAALPRMQTCNIINPCKIFKKQISTIIIQTVFFAAFIAVQCSPDALSTHSLYLRNKHAQTC